MKTAVGKGLATAALCALLWIQVGCQTPDKLVKVEKSGSCPTCAMETRTTPIKGLTYEKCVCPNCRTVTTVDPRLADTVRGYVGDEIGDTIHVCDHCKSVVETCPVCRKMSKAP